MKLSIWQQFSSNHSAYFSVVGTFSSTEEAQRAANKLHKIDSQVWQWLQELPREEAFAWHEKSHETITPIEAKIQKLEQMSWFPSLLQFRPLELNNHLLVRQNHVFVEPAAITWFGPNPYPALLQALGANVNICVSESRTHPDCLLLVDISCKLPDDELDAAILFESFREDFYAYRNDSRRIYNFDTIDNLQLPFDYESLKYRFTDEFPHFEAQHEGDLLNLKGLAFGAGWSWSRDLDETIKFLSDEGCTNISYEFSSVPYTYSRNDE